MHDGPEPYAQAFAAAGAHVLAVDYRGFGGSSGQPRARFRVREQRAFWRAALAAARGLDGGRADNVIAWGFSFGDGHVAALAAGGEPFAAAIVLCPLVDGLARALSVNRCSAARVLPAAIRDAMGRHALVPVTGTPGARAAMPLPGEVKGFPARWATGRTGGHRSPRKSCCSCRFCDRCATLDASPHHYGSGSPTTTSASPRTPWKDLPRSPPPPPPPPPPPKGVSGQAISITPCIKAGVARAVAPS
ncbi:alpha/beta fold hydrolase [Mycobacterium hodleri]|uniref:Alpha/beta fold hydrolase n=2 Tax=Mycolicibacterium hodleri TaxID=49897 RepID=A0A502EC93_9MYCO|nr:alpha/beta fold hydrolase [Mycolicibacterium hodleri]